MRRKDLLTTRIILKKINGCWEFKLLIKKNETDDETIAQIITACSVSEECFLQSINELEKSFGESRVSDIVLRMRQRKIELIESSMSDRSINDHHLPLVPVIEITRRINKDA